MKKLKNQYYILRHGQSQANTTGIIISDPSNGIKSFGLTDTGKSRIIEEVKRYTELNNESIIYTSPFLRAKETARLVKKILNSKKIFTSDKLSERYFGDYEKSSNTNYQKVWDKDKFNENNNKNNVESTKQVWDRMVSLINETEQKYSNKKIILISHGDPLQILITGFNNIPINHHRQIKHLNTAEIRKLN